MRRLLLRFLSLDVLAPDRNDLAKAVEKGSEVDDLLKQVKGCRRVVRCPEDVEQRVELARAHYKARDQQIAAANRS